MITKSRCSGPSARMIRDRIYEVTGTYFLVSDNITKKVDINYGSVDPKIKCEYNSIEFVRLCSDKRRFCDLMAEVGVKSPIYRRGKPASYPCIVRDSLYSFGGAGCHVFKTEEEYLKSGLSTKLNWSPFLKCKSEFRAHVIDGEIKKLYKKAWRKDEPEDELPIRNHWDGGYVFRTVKKSTWKDWKKLLDTVEKIHKAIKGSFYGLDIAWSDLLKEWVVFEANTAPGLADCTVDYYVEYFIKVLGLKLNENVVLRTTEVA